MKKILKALLGTGILACILTSIVSCATFKAYIPEAGDYDMEPIYVSQTALTWKNYKLDFNTGNNFASDMFLSSLSLTGNVSIQNAILYNGRDSEAEVEIVKMGDSSSFYASGLYFSASNHYENVNIKQFGRDAETSYIDVQFIFKKIDEEGKVKSNSTSNPTALRITAYGMPYAYVDLISEPGNVYLNPFYNQNLTRDEESVLAATILAYYQFYTEKISPSYYLNLFL